MFGNAFEYIKYYALPHLFIYFTISLCCCSLLYCSLLLLTAYIFLWKTRDLAVQSSSSLSISTPFAARTRIETTWLQLCSWYAEICFPSTCFRIHIFPPCLYIHLNHDSFSSFLLRIMWTLSIHLRMWYALQVAEKPSIASSVASLLSSGRVCICDSSVIS